MSGKFSSKKYSDIEPSPEQASSMTNEMLANTSFSNNVSIVQSKEEKVFKGSDKTYISLGRDRPAELGTGQEYESNGAIYICAGASNGVPAEQGTNEEGLELNANRNFNIDASTIYISSNCNIDDYFGITSEFEDPSTPNTAGIAVKSTNLRLVARDKIKLVTRTDTTNEWGSPLDSSVNGIELIAGNDSSALEPIVKGKKLVKAFEDLDKSILTPTLQALKLFLQQQIKFNAILAKHTHPSVFNMLVGTIVAGGPKSVAKGRTLVDNKTNTQGNSTNGFLGERALSNVEKAIKHVELFKKQFLTDGGDDYINSRHNKVN